MVELAHIQWLALMGTREVVKLDVDKKPTNVAAA